MSCSRTQHNDGCGDQTQDLLIQESDTKCHIKCVDMSYWPDQNVCLKRSDQRIHVHTFYQRLTGTVKEITQYKEI